MSFVQELKRRNVFRVAVAYVVAAWVIIEVSSLILDIYESPDSVIRTLVALLALGLPFALVFAWAFEVTPEGIKRESEVDRSRSMTHQTAKRLDLLTIGMVVIAVVLFSVVRFLPSQFRDATVAAVEDSVTDKIVWATQQVLEIDRLRNIGQFRNAFDLASEITPLLPDEAVTDDFWTGFSWSTDIKTDPPGARVFRQPIDAPADEWEDLGTTPLQSVRFAEGVGYRLRFELAGYRPVELLDSAVSREFFSDIAGREAVRLDLESALPNEMVRVFGFTEDLVEYEDFFMDRYEITNKEYQEFVSVGGYDTEKYWTHEFIRDGRRLLRNEAIREFVDRTGRPGPATWSGGTYPDGQSDYPVGGVSWYEAAAFANFRGKTLPTVTHHTAARRHYNANSWLIAPRSNLGTSGPLPIGTNRAMTALGIYDLVGNVREWNSNDAGLGQRATTGASWADPPYNATSIIPKSPWDRDSSNGIRLVKVFDSAEKIAKLAEPAQPLDRRDFRNLIPASDNEVEIFKRRYAYDPAPLKDEIEDVQEFEHWTRQQIAFDLPYGERGGAFLFLPKSAAPPFETVVYWPGTGALWWRSIDEAYYPAFSFIIRSGRAVAIPLFKGTYHRDDADFSITDETLWPTRESASTKKYSDYEVKHIIDFSRTIDYIKTRNDLRTEKIGYFGFSWGGEEAFIALVVDGRLDAAVLNVGGVDGSYLYRPENDPFNYVKHVRTPTLMINGEFDTAFPVDTSQKPIFELLGTEPKDKKMIITPAAHFVPQDVLIKETLDWFDKYLRVSIHMAE